MSEKDKPVIAQDKEWEGIFAVLLRVKGLDFACYKPAIISRRLARRIVLAKQGKLKDYIRFLRENEDEAEHLYENLLINVTGFFRDPKSFRALEKSVIPSILKNKAKGQGLRIWVPGCSGGEEAYSIAMLIAEALGARAGITPVRIFATDVSDAGIGKARRGVYGPSVKNTVSPARLKRFFTKEGVNYKVSRNLRDMCVFSKHNVFADPPFSSVDLVSCRNLLTYLQPVFQKKILRNFHYSLRPGGFLFLGNSEEAGRDLFSALDRSSRIFMKKHLFLEPKLEPARKHYLPKETEIEEIKTANEELQFLNEELATANRELHKRNAEVSLLNSDLVNFLGSINLPVVMLGLDLVIRRMTPQAEKALNIVSSDVGRPIGKVKFNIDIPGLEEMLLEVIESSRPKTFEIKDKVASWYSVCIRPYRGIDNRIDGAVIMFIDITERKKAEEGLRKSEEFTRRVIQSSNDCIKVLDWDGNLLSMSQGGQKLMEIDDITPYLNKSWIDFWKGKDREAALEAISRARKGDVGIFYGHCETAKGTPKWWEIIVSSIKDSPDSTERLLSVSRDITERKNLEDALSQALERKNIALREVMEQVEIEKKKIKDDVLANVNKLAMPIIRKLGAKGVGRKYIDLLSNRLSGLASSLGSELTGGMFKLSPREIEICNLIEGGMSSKEIADFLHISRQTTEKHRKNIRKKLKLNRKKINLTTYLQKKANLTA